MEDKIKITCNVFEPRINGDGTIISPEVLDKAIKDYLDRPDKKLVYIDKGDDIGTPLLSQRFHLEDAVGTLDHIERKEDNSFMADCSIYTATPKGKMLGELMDFPEIKNRGFSIKPYGYYDKEHDELTIMDYSIELD